MSISVSSTSSLQRPDMAEMRANLFKTADSDGNGTLSKSEMSTAMQNAPKPPGGPGGPGGPKGSKGTDSTEASKTADEIFAEMDSDGSGEVTQDELKAFDEARQAAMEAKRAETFDGSGDFLRKILEELTQASSASSSSSTTTTTTTTSTSSDSSTGSSSVSGSTSTTASATNTRDELIALLVKKLQEQNPTYQLDGSTSSADTVGLFSKTV